MMTKRHNAAALAFLAFLGLALLSLPAWAGVCSSDSPATPVPQFDEDLAPGVSLWPLDPVTGDIRLQPAGLPEGITRDDVPVLPANRDSSDYVTLTIPGEWSGHELFMDVAAADSRTQGAPVSDWVVMAYNSGVEVWDVATDPASPILLDQRDGWGLPFGPGEWAVFPPGGEQDTFVQAVDVVEEADRLIIGIAATESTGFSVWLFDKLSGDLEQVYQDPFNIIAYDVSLVTDPDGKIYAFVTDTGTAGDDGGIKVYDVSAAAAGPLCVEPGGGHTCGVFTGEMADLPKARHVSTLVVDGETYVAASDGKQITNPLDLEIWQVADPQNPAAAPAGSSSLKFAGLGDRVSAPQLFTYNGAHYLALVEDVGASPYPDQMRIHEIGDCLDADGCAGLGPALATETIKNSFPTDHFLNVSFSSGLPFLYYGMQTTGLFGDGWERLFELELLPSTFAADTLPELTDGGGTYIDPCNGEAVGYFGDYYVGNEYGISRFNPRHAVFNGVYLFRAGLSVFDVHHRRSVSTTIIFSDGFESGDTSAWSTVSP